MKQTLHSAALGVAISGLMLLTFMADHVFQYRFGETPTSLALVRPPLYYINLSGQPSLSRFWVDRSVQLEGVRGIGLLDLPEPRTP